MCGRFTLATGACDVQTLFPWITVPTGSLLVPRYNIAPGQHAAVIPNDGLNNLVCFRWGLTPPWVKKHKVASLLINARSETVGGKPTFKDAYCRRRCLVLADGFYEWQRGSGGRSKVPFYVRMTSGEPFAFAGLWDAVSMLEEPDFRGFAILTTTPNALMKPIHFRMPVVLPPEAHEAWLDPREQKPDTLDKWLRPFPSQDMVAHPVSTLVNNHMNESQACTSPV